MAILGLMATALVTASMLHVTAKDTTGGQTQEGETGECSAIGSCGSSTKALSWRGFPYSVKNPVYAKKIYGGGYVADRFAKAGFQGPVEGDDWNVLWTHRWQPLPQRKEPERRLTNHCTFFGAAGDKCTFARHVSAVMRALPQSPLHSRGAIRTFELADRQDFDAWMLAATNAPGSHWVLKPCMGGASKGIDMISSDDVLHARYSFKGPTVAQEYVALPYLGLGGGKFHLRMYLLVTRWSPPAVYLYNNGLVIRNREKYDKNQRDTKRDIFSVIEGSIEALPFSDLWNHLDSSTPLVKENMSASVWARIQEAFREMLGQNLQESFGSFERIEEQRGHGCFDLFGADVILDSRLEPYVMEINTGPNIWIDDRGEGTKQQLTEVKGPLIEELVDWIALRLRRPPTSSIEADKVEQETLRNYTKVL